MWRQTFHYSQIHYCYLICVGWWNAYHADCITLQSTIEAVGTCYIKLSMKWILKGKWISSKITLPFTLRNHFWKGKSSNETVSSPLWVEQLSLWTFLQESAVIHALRFLLSFGSLRKQLGVFHADTVNFGDTELHVFSVNFPLILPSPPPPSSEFCDGPKGLRPWKRFPCPPPPPGIERIWWIRIEPKNPVSLTPRNTWSDLAITAAVMTCWRARSLSKCSWVSLTCDSATCRADGEETKRPNDLAAETWQPPFFGLYFFCREDLQLSRQLWNYYGGQHCT